MEQATLGLPAMLASASTMMRITNEASSDSLALRPMAYKPAKDRPDQSVTHRHRAIRPLTGGGRILTGDYRGNLRYLHGMMRHGSVPGLPESLHVFWKAERYANVFFEKGITGADEHTLDTEHLRCLLAG